jgi:hypothetical protein
MPPAADAKAAAASHEKVAVVLRARPPRADRGRPCVSAGEGRGTVLTHDGGADRQGKVLSFSYTRAFFWDTPGASTTRDLYDAVGRTLLAQTLRGYHTSLLAYGQTGA